MDKVLMKKETKRVKLREREGKRDAYLTLRKKNKRHNPWEKQK